MKVGQLNIFFFYTKLSDKKLKFHIALNHPSISLLIKYLYLKEKI